MVLEPKKKNPGNTDFRGSLAMGIRALFHSRISEANAQVRTSSELTFPYS